MDAQSLYVSLYIEINLAAALLIAIVRIKTLGLSRMVAQRNFSMAADSEVCCILSDTLCVVLVSGLLPPSRALLTAAKTVYFFTTTLMCFFWFVYFEHMRGSAFVKDRRKVLACSSLVWVMGAMLLVNLFTGVLFRVDESGAYFRGPLFLLQYLLAYVYVFSAGIRALIGLLRKENYAQRRMLTSLALFPLAPAVAGIVQFRLPQLPLACMALSLATLILYLEWTDQMISIDPLTRLNNRKQLNYFYEQWRGGAETDQALYLLLIDANKFKSINDTYGHVQGDAALTRIAEALRLACRELPRRTNIARYGGDEFVVLMWAEQPEAVDTLRARISEVLADLNGRANAPYELSVSIGAARADADKPLRELIEAADEQLYEEKRRRKSAAIPVK